MTRTEAEKVFESELEKLHAENQFLMDALRESESLRMQVEDALESELHHDHVGEDFSESKCTARS